MGHFVPDETVRVEVGGGEWVDIKKQLSVGDYEKIAVESVSDVTEGRITATLVTIIKAWNLLDNGREMPVDRESIERLDQNVAIKLITALGKYNKGLTLKKA